MERKVLDSCGISGTGETPQERKRRGGSPPAPRKASILKRKSTTPFIATMFLKEHFGKALLLLPCYFLTFT
ncbi:hypothetical protein FBF83_15055 [Pseudalkalibacillus hwajinpoensis]|uniref:Uncharacterized protein n=1 Tax=Guptibacillus hwajinpoensis TaxID=208199 RepID=A0A4U1MER0_9BACL|nr:hypothetical protein FBF83_15055 [Pseudalkalibacillus hwajinpoensis]